MDELTIYRLYLQSEIDFQGHLSFKISFVNHKHSIVFTNIKYLKNEIVLIQYRRHNSEIKAWKVKNRL